MVNTVAALASTAGGILLVGIDERNPDFDSAAGVKAEEQVSVVQACQSKLDPLFDSEIGLVAIPGRTKSSCRQGAAARPRLKRTG